MTKLWDKDGLQNCGISSVWLECHAVPKSLRWTKKCQAHAKSSQKLTWVDIYTASRHKCFVFLDALLLYRL